MSKTVPVRNIMVITSWGYREGLVQSSTLPYLRMIHEARPAAHILLVTEEKTGWWQDADALGQVQQALGADHISLVPLPYHRFGLRKIISALFQFLRLWWLILTRNVSHIHCFCTPAGSIGYLLSVLTGRRLVLDSYEPHAEAMVENGSWQRSGLAFRMLWWFEKRQAARASACLAVASGMDQYALRSYGVKVPVIGVRPCCVDLDLFRYDATGAAAIRAELQWTDKIVCAYAGKFGDIYLDREVFDFFAVAQRHWGARFQVLLLTPTDRSEIERWCAQSGLDPLAVYSRTVAYTDMPRWLSVADFAITPVRPVPSKRYCSPIKDGEYWALGLPVVITSNISDDSDIIRSHQAGVVLEQLDAHSFNQAVAGIDALLHTDRNQLREKIRAIAIRYRNFETAALLYRQLYGTAS